MPREQKISYKTREKGYFANIRKTIKTRKDLVPLINILNGFVDEKTRSGPLTLIFHYDTPVDGFDAELGYLVEKPFSNNELSTRTLEEAHFFSIMHHRSYKTINESQKKVYEFMYSKGLSAAMELVEILHDVDFKNQERVKIEIQASFLPWGEWYLKSLIEILGEEKAVEIWKGGEKITPFTDIKERTQWVKETLERLKLNSSNKEQFEIISRIALPRPIEEINIYKKVYEETKSIEKTLDKIIESQNWIEKPEIIGNTIKISKVAYNREGWDKATNHEEKRQSYCFCALVRKNPDNPDIDPIFCYRAAGWSRQMWEEVLGTRIIDGKIRKSILLGDDYCAFDLELPAFWKRY
jgi:hypothetical protein